MRNVYIYFAVQLIQLIPGIQGPTCEERIPFEKCQTKPCFNSGECFNNTKSGEFYCSCKPGYHGDLCSVGGFDWLINIT